ncbi:MAG: heterodisulfide reductase-related iron-sulfur binding cluster [Syntrophorhabdaceae bacterium]|nr:heterodisulfide reductase-related iron-sulfur binding cluster [Syntrophorhabdaceae bacterium]
MFVLSYYPGCSLKTSSSFYEASIKDVLSFYDIDLKEIDDWSCCGASAAIALDDLLCHSLPARNLAIAEAEGYHLICPCPACYQRLRITNEKMRTDRSLMDEVNDVIAPLSCLGSIEVKNIIEVITDHVGLERVAGGIRYDLSSITVVPYYGCVLTRSQRIRPFDDTEDPVSMDNIISATGASVLTWQYKMECCGAGKTITDKDATLRHSSGIMDMALRIGADAIVTPCPLCQLNLDLLPLMGRKKETIPVIFITEVLEMAISGVIRGSKSHIIPVDNLLTKVKKIKL